MTLSHSLKARPHCISSVSLSLFLTSGSTVRNKKYPPWTFIYISAIPLNCWTQLYAHVGLWSSYLAYTDLLFPLILDKITAYAMSDVTTRYLCSKISKQWNNRVVSTGSISSIQSKEMGAARRNVEFELKTVNLRFFAHQRWHDALIKVHYRTRRSEEHNVGFPDRRRGWHMGAPKSSKFGMHV